MRTASSLAAELAELHPDRWTEPFWSAARERRLVAPQCSSCGTFRMPPGPYCPSCRHQDVRWIELSGVGTVYSFVVSHQALVPALADHTPFVIALVEFEEAPGIRLVTNLVDTEVESVHIGMAVTVSWDPVHPDVTLPRFTPR